jgi:hypothetical protein
MPFPVSESDLAAAEVALGGRLPESLREYLMRDNGGDVATEDDNFELYKVLDTSDPARQARTSARDIVRENASLRKWTGFPSEAVAIADNGAGDALLLLKEGDAFGNSVYLWAHETADLLLVGSVGDLFE